MTMQLKFTLNEILLLREKDVYTSGNIDLLSDTGPTRSTGTGDDYFNERELFTFEKFDREFNMYDEKTLDNREEMNQRQKKSRVFYINAPDGKDEQIDVDVVTDIIDAWGEYHHESYYGYFRNFRKLPPQIATMCIARRDDKQFGVLTVSGLDMQPGTAEAEWAKQNNHFEIFYDNLMVLILRSILDLKEYKYVIFCEIGTDYFLDNVANKEAKRNKIREKMSDLLVDIKKQSTKNIAGMGIPPESSLNKVLQNQNFEFKDSSGNTIQSRDWKNEEFEHWLHNLPKEMLEKTLFINSGDPRRKLGNGNGIDYYIGIESDLYLIGQGVLNGTEKPKQIMRRDT